MSFDDDIDPDLVADTFASMARDGVYQPLVGAAVDPCPMVIDQQTASNDQWPETVEDRPRGQVQATDVDPPRRGDTWTETATGQVYTVDGINAFDGSVYEVLFR